MQELRVLPQIPFVARRMIGVGVGVGFTVSFGREQEVLAPPFRPRHIQR